jgi:hypothetical protein
MRDPHAVSSSSGGAASSPHVLCFDSIVRTPLMRYSWRQRPVGSRLHHRFR